MKPRKCAECGAYIVPEGSPAEASAETCAECGQARIPETTNEMAPAMAPPDDAPDFEDVEIRIGSGPGGTQWRRFQQGPFVVREVYTRRTGDQGFGCGCGCLFLLFVIYLIFRGFFSLF